MKHSIMLIEEKQVTLFKTVAGLYWVTLPELGLFKKIKI